MAQEHAPPPVDLGISPAALLVVESARVADAGQHQPMANASDIFAIARQPGDGPDRSGNKQKPIRVAKIASGKNSARAVATVNPERLSFASDG